MGLSHLTLSELEMSLKAQTLKVTQIWLVEDLYGIHTYICQQLITPLI